MRLLDLDPQLYRRLVREETWQQVVGDPLVWKAGDPTEEVTGDREYYDPVTMLDKADGLMLTCPKCQVVQPGARPSGHKVMCWFYGRVPDSVTPSPGRWAPSGTGLHDLTFVPNPRSSQVSVHLTGGGCGAHFNVADGEVTNA